MKPAPRLLVVDDEPAIGFGIAAYFRTRGFEVTICEDGAAAIAAVKVAPFDLVLCDHGLPDHDGLSIMRLLRVEAPTAPFVLLTGLGSIELAVQAIKEGAAHFLTKPVDLATLETLFKRLLAERRNARIAASQRTAPVADPYRTEAGGGDGPTEAARRAAAVMTPVLILGETGSGKGVLARWLRAAGPRADEPLVELNCAGLSRELAESELFGHERGAFTSAGATKPGLLEIADRGTLFLDEVAELDLLVQAKLLKVLEDQCFRRVGGTRDQHVSVRLIAATSADIGALVEAGRFRRDLYFRIAALVLTVPPLRLRLDELAALAATILATVHPTATLAPSAVAALKEHSWPGNVRELRNVLERAVLFADSPELDDHDVRPHLVVPTGSAAPPTPASGVRRLTLAEVERDHVESVIAAVDGRVDLAAEWLGIPRSTLYERLRRYKLKPGS